MTNYYSETINYCTRCAYCIIHDPYYMSTVGKVYISCLATRRKACGFTAYIVEINIELL